MPHFIPPEQSSSSLSPLALITSMLGLLIGAIFALVFLLLKPTPTIEEIPETPKIGSVYYLPGSKAGTSYWKQIRHVFFSPKRIKVTLNENDLNKWATSTLTIYDQNKQNKGSSLIQWNAQGAPNFRIHNGTLHIALNTELSISGTILPVLWQASGNFEKTEWGYEFKPHTMYLGSLNIPKRFSPLVIDELILPAFSNKSEPNKLKEAWSKLAWIKVHDDVLQIARTE